MQCAFAGMVYICRSKTSSEVFVWKFGALLYVCRALFRICRALWRYGAFPAPKHRRRSLLRISRALLRIYKTLLWIYKTLLRLSRGFLRIPSRQDSNARKVRFRQYAKDTCLHFVGGSPLDLNIWPNVEKRQFARDLQNPLFQMAM